MNGHLDRAVPVTRRVVDDIQSDRISFVTASLAYYALISLLPLLPLALAAAATLGDPGTVERLVDATAALDDRAGPLVREALAGAATGAGVDRTVRGIDLLGFAGSAGLVVGLTVAFLPLYHLLPGEDVSVREALPGAVLAAVGWTLLQTGFRVYAAGAAGYETYGVLGGTLLLVTFLYVGAPLLLVGVVLNAVLAGRGHTALPGRGADTPEPTAVLDGTMTRDRPDDPSEEQLREELERLHEELDRVEEHIEDRTVHREEIESDLRRYVRRRVRRGKARGWGPYLVLLYGTAMTLGAFFFLRGVWAILAMLVVWLSTLGLYALMLIVGTTVTVAGLPGRLRDRFDRR